MGNVVFGSMRMTEEVNSVEVWVNLFKEMWDQGIRIHHVSSEYESYPLYLKVLAEFREAYPACPVDFIVKFAEPHFGQVDFDPKLFLEGIEKYRHALQVQTIFSVQWMWRGNLQEEQQRLNNFKAVIPQLEELVELTKRTARIKHFHVFPYTIAFAELALSCSFVDGLIVYRNAHENEYSDLINQQHSLGKWGYVLRPLAAGKLDFSACKPHEFFQSATSLPSIAGGIVSISSVSRLKELIA